MLVHIHEGLYVDAARVISVEGATGVNDICQAIPTATTNRRRRKIKLQRSQFLPTDAENLTQEQVDFMMALDKFKRDKRRPFPTCSEVLSVLLSLGYRKGRLP